MPTAPPRHPILQKQLPGQKPPRGVRNRLRYSKQTGKLACNSFAICIGDPPVENAHGRKWADVLQGTRGTIRELILQVGEAIHLRGNNVDSGNQLIPPIPKGKELVCYRLVKAGPVETALVDSTITEAFTPVRSIAEPVDVLCLFLEGESDQCICGPVPR